MARFALLDILVNNAGLMLLGTVVGADPEDWGRMLAVTSWTCCTSLTLHCRTWSKPPKDSPRRVADMVNISSIAGCTARNWCRVDNLTKFGVNGFIESVRQEVTQRHPGPRRRPRRAKLVAGRITLNGVDESCYDLTEALESFPDLVDACADRSLAPAIAAVRLPSSPNLSKSQITKCVSGWGITCVKVRL